MYRKNEGVALKLRRESLIYKHTVASPKNVGNTFIPETRNYSEPAGTPLYSIVFRANLCRLANETRLTISHCF